MEYWDIYDIHRIKQNKTIRRGQKLDDNQYHLVVHVCILNANNQMLIQQRQPFKSGWPNMWDITVGGSAIQNETSQMAIERELFEELGIQHDFTSIRPHLTINFNQGFDDIYLLKKEADIHDLNLQYEEVKQVKWASKEEILSLIEKGQFIPYYPYLIHLLFDMKDQYGAFK